MFLRALRVSAAACAYSPLLVVAAGYGLCGKNSSMLAGVGNYIARVMASCGGALPKFGQILSTRPDLLPAQLCAQLAVLQHDMPKMSKRALALALRLAGEPLYGIAIDPTPEASGTIAQVHCATPMAASGKLLALKIRRPNVHTRIVRDCRIAETLLPLLQRLSFCRSLPIREAVHDTSVALQRQTDFLCEAESLQRLSRDFSSMPGVLVPFVDREYSADGVLAMQYLGNLMKITDPRIPERQSRELVRLGLKCLYRMIFETGFLHCDLHPGNLMVTEDGRLAILDAGFMVELDDFTRRSFAQFFASIALRNGRRAAEIIRNTATALPVELDRERFDQEIEALITRTGGLSAERFQVAGFVADLFAIQARHGIRGTSRFSLIILSLLVYEGTAKQRFSTLDFQKEAIPFIVDALLTPQAR